MIPVKLKKLGIRGRNIKLRGLSIENQGLHIINVILKLDLPLCAVCSSDEQGDRPRPLPVIPELDSASDVFERKLQPAWDFKVPN